MQNPTLQYEKEGNTPDVFAHASPSFSLSETAVNLLQVQIQVYPGISSTVPEHLSGIVQWLT